MRINQRSTKQRSTDKRSPGYRVVAAPAALMCAAFATSGWSQDQADDASFPAETQITETIPVDPQLESESAAVEPEDSGPSRVLEEIVVTAQKREESLKDVPISVAAFSGDKLEALGIGDPTEFQRVTPGLTYASQIGYAIIYIRGLGSDAYLPSADTSVATYVDGVYFPFAQNLASQFTKLERVEILKGPQGTLFGRNSTAGAINIISRKPTDSFEGSLDFTAGNFDKQTAKVFLSGPILDNVSVSGSAIYDSQDPFHRFAPDSPQQTARPAHTAGVNLRLLWEPTDNLSALMSVYRVRFNGAEPGLQRLEDPNPVSIGFTPEIDEPYVISSNIDAVLQNDNDVVYGTFQWTPTPFEVKLSGSYQEVDTGTTFDFDGGPSSLASLNGNGQGARTVTSELQLTSVEDGLLGSWLEWTAGYYYYKNKGGFSSLLFDVVGADAAQAGSFPLSVFALALQPVNDALEALMVPSPAGGLVTLKLQGLVATEAHAVYAQGTWRPTDWFGLTLGGRYQDEFRESLAASTAVVFEGADPVTVFDHPGDSKTNKVFSPKVTLDFHPFADDSMIYLSWQRANKSGTYNVVSVQRPPAYIEPEKLEAYELGIKGALFDGTFSYNAATFHYGIEDLQTIVVSATSGGIAQFLNVPKSEFYGVDLDFTWQPLSELAPGFIIIGSGAWLHHEFTDFKDGAGFDPETGLYFGPGESVPSDPVDFTGNKTVRTPDWSGNLGFSYTFDVRGGAIELGTSASYSDGYFYDPQNATRQDATTLVDARLSYFYERWNVRVSAFGKNLTDKVYYQNKLATDFGESASFAAPRMYGMTLGWEF